MNPQSSYGVYFTLARRKKRKPKPQESSNALNNSDKIPSTPAAPVFGDLGQHQHMCAETFNSNMNGSDQFS
jgi:hypothetical protein